MHFNEDAESDKLIKDALQDNHVMFQNKKDCWLSCVYMILKECNLLRFFNNPQAMTNHLRDHGGKLCFDFGVDILNKMT